MKTVVEFGAKRGRHVDNQVMPSLKSGTELARRLAYVFGGTLEECSRKNPRVIWQSDTHFVALSILDGKDRGPASAYLWSPK